VDGYVRLDVSGTYTPGNEVVKMKSMWREIADQCRSNGVEHALAVSEVKGALSTMAGYELASEPTSFGWERNFHIAIAFTDKERFESQLFTETVMVNRYYDIKAFMDVDEAKAWLVTR
jgi:hypothetical protein